MHPPATAAGQRLPLLLLIAACSQEPPAEAPAEPAAAAADADQIDLVIEGDYIVTMDNDGNVVANGAVAVDDGLIIAIGPAAEINASYSAAGHLDGDNRIVMPGLVNGHSHAAMTLLRGVADDLDLMDWLQNYIFPAEVAFVDEEFVRIGTELACWEMIRGGTTTFVDMYYYPDVIAQVVEQCGLRAYISATVIDQRSPDAESAADSLNKGENFVDNWLGRNDRITPIWGPHANYTLNAEQLADTRTAAVTNRTLRSAFTCPNRHSKSSTRSRPTARPASSSSIRLASWTGRQLARMSSGRRKTRSRFLQTRESV